MKDIEKGLIDSKLQTIDEKLELIMESQKRMENHNAFILNIYLRFRTPIVNFFNQINNLIGYSSQEFRELNN